MHNIVVIGGGTGSFAMLLGLKKLPDVSLTAVVPSTDSGGSTGRLKDEFGSLPIGDVRQCLAALAEDQEESILLRQLFSYRFDRGEEGLKGHNMGNLLLTALTEILGSEIKAIASMEKLMNIRGHVYPVTTAKTDLVAQYENGNMIKGEHHIDEPSYPHDGRLKITKLYTEPAAEVYPAVSNAIAAADVIITGPGDVFTSLLANFVVHGMADALQRSPAKFVYVVNLVTKFGQTHDMTARQHVDEIAQYTGRRPDYVLINDNDLPADILERYAAENAYPVVDDLGDGPGVIRTDLLARERVVTPKGDVLKRSLIRHDGDRVAQEVSKILRVSS